MTEVRFYHLTRTSLEAALPVMLEKTLERGQRAVVIAGSDERVESLNAQLQPVWLTARDENPNGAEVLFLTDGATAQSLADYKLCAMLFDGGNDTAVQLARDQWRTLKEAGHEVTYWKQDETGRWAQQA
jgi:DNA polymerase-3 subunit chi